MLVKGYPFEIQGRMTEALEVTEAAVEGARLSSNPHNLSWGAFELAWAHYYLGNLDEAVDLCVRRAYRRWPAGGQHNAGGQRRARLAFYVRAPSGDRAQGSRWWRPSAAGPWSTPYRSSAVSTGRSSPRSSLLAQTLDAAARYVDLAEEQAARLGLALPIALARRGRAALLLASEDASGA